jgi:hypothetical protein
MSGNTKEKISDNMDSNITTSDYIYNRTGFSSKQTEEEKIDKVEILIKVLGTMVINPSYDSDPNNIGKKIFTGPIQSPMLQGDSRKVAEDKLVELIKTL